LRLEPDRLPLLRPFEDDERDFAVVRLLPDEPFEELFLLDEERPRELEPDDLDLEPEPEDLDLEPEPDLDLLDAELRLLELDEERCFFTSPSSIVPRQAPSSSSSIIT
jgi:hypothetical protein